MASGKLSRGYGIAMAATLFWSTTAIFIKYLNTHYQLPPLVLAFWRDLFVVISLWIGLRLLKPDLLHLPDARRHLPFFVLYGLVLALFNSLWTVSVALNGAAVATVLAYSSPAFTALLGWRFLNEKLNAVKILAVGLSMVGCVLVAGAHDPAAWRVNPIGIIVGLLAGIMFAAYSLCGKTASQRGVEAWTTMLYVFLFGTLFLLLAQRPDTILWLGSSVSGWSVLILLAIVPTIGGYGLYTVSLAYLPASVANLLATLEPPMTALLAYALLGERLTTDQLIGSGLILAGVIVLRLGDLAPVFRKPARRYYPGTGENPFHFALVALDHLGRIPMPLMPLLLALLAILPFHLLPSTFYLLPFLLSDLALLYALPRLGRSFGPPQPPALLMGMARVGVALFINALTRIGLPPAWAWWLVLIAQAAGSLLAIEAYWFGPYRLSVTHRTLRSPKLDANAPPLRLLHLSDLHIERLTTREHQLIEQINRLQPDAILFSGDLLGLGRANDARAQADCRAWLSQLHAPLGVYAVSGSLPVDTPQAMRAVLAGLPIRRLDNERVTLAKDGQSVDLLGVSCTHRPEADALHLNALMDGQPDRFRVLLYHTPDLAPEAAQAGVDLQLSGHTHGGQVRLPGLGALITSSLYGKRFEMGEYRLGAMTLYVSRGIGLEGMGAPRVRFLCPPEIVLWEISGGTGELVQ